MQLIEAMLAKEPDGRPTLAAIRAVLKRLKGSKIPTMTAAGLAMPPGPGTPYTHPPTNSAPTMNEMPYPSMEMTRRREPGAPSMSEAMPLPAPPPTPMPDHPSMSYQSMNILSQQTLAGHSMPGASTSNPAHRLPSGVSMQHQQFPPLMAPTNPGVPSTPPPYRSMPGASMPTPGRSVAATQAPASDARRYLVIVIAAIVVSAIGIALLLAS